MSRVDAQTPVVTDSGGPRSREDVVAAASHLFATRGFHGTSMRDLGEELGMLGSSIYSHIKGKNELLVEVIGRGAALFDGVVARAASDDAPAIDRLRRLVSGHVEVVVGDIDASRTFLFESRFLPDSDRTQIVAMRDSYETVFRDTIQAAVAEGALRPDVEPGLTAIFMLSVLNAVSRWYRPSGERDASEIAAAMWTFIVRGIEAGDSR